jgi:hypothetical protein
MNKKTAIIALGATIILAIFILFLLRDDGDETSIIDQLNPFDEVSRSGEGGFLSESQLSKLILKADPQAEYEAYRAYARYPHESRPLSKKMTDLTQPWKIDPVRLPIITNPDYSTENSFKAYKEKMLKEGKTPEQIEAELKDALSRTPGYEFSANRHTLTQGDELIVTLAATDTSDEKLSITITEAIIKGDAVFDSPSLGSVHFNDEGTDQDKQAGDKTYTMSWKLPSADRKYWGNMDLVVKARVPGINDEVTLHHHFFASPIAPATFTNQFNERLEDGSLVIDHVVDVKMECRFQFQANLFSVTEDAPTHWATLNKVLSPGRHTISYLFFGKIFRDGGFEGKFRMQNIRATCENLPFPASWLGDPSKVDQILNVEPKKEPLLLYVPFSALSYTTQQSYSLTSFSDKEWESEEKNRHLEELKKSKGL